MIVTKNKSSHALMEFKDSENRTLRYLMVNNQPVFVAREVCDFLAIKHQASATRALDEDEKLMCKVCISGQSRNLLHLTESGMYHLTFRSNKTEAKVFRRWVTSVVLPTIRKTGSYKIEPQLSAPVDTELYKQLRRKFFREVGNVYLNRVRYYHLTDVCKLIGLSITSQSGQVFAKSKGGNNVIQLGSQAAGSWYGNEGALKEFLLSRENLNSKTLYAALFITNQKEVQNGTL